MEHDGPAGIRLGSVLAILAYVIGSLVTLVGAISWGFQLVLMPIGLALIFAGALRREPRAAFTFAGASLGVSAASWLSYSFGLAQTIFQPNLLLLLGLMISLGFLGYSTGRGIEGSSGTAPGPPGLYVGIGIALLLLGIFAIFSLGIYLIFIALVMLSVVWAWHRRPWVVAGALTGAMTTVFARFLTAPMSCSVYETAGSFGATREASCGRIILPDVQGLDTTSANVLALVLALGVGLLVGLLVGRAVRRNSSPVPA